MIFGFQVGLKLSDIISTAGGPTTAVGGLRLIEAAGLGHVRPKETKLDTGRLVYCLAPNKWFYIQAGSYDSKEELGPDSVIIIDETDRVLRVPVMISHSWDPIPEGPDEEVQQ